MSDDDDGTAGTGVVSGEWDVDADDDEDVVINVDNEDDGMSVVIVIVGEVVVVEVIGHKLGLVMTMAMSSKVEGSSRHKVVVGPNFTKTQEIEVHSVHIISNLHPINKYKYKHKYKYININTNINKYTYNMNTYTL